MSLKTWSAGAPGARIAYRRRGWDERRRIAGLGRNGRKDAGFITNLLARIGEVEKLHQA